MLISEKRREAKENLPDLFQKVVSINSFILGRWLMGNLTEDQVRRYLIEQIYSKESWIFVDPDDDLMLDIQREFYSDEGSDFVKISGDFSGSPMTVLVVSKDGMNPRELHSLLKRTVVESVPAKANLEKQDILAPGPSMEESRKAADRLFDFLENEAA